MLQTILTLAFAVLFTPQPMLALDSSTTTASVSTSTSVVALVKELSSQNKVNEETVMRIIECESSWNPKAIGRQAVVGEDVGLFQINSYYHESDFQKEGLDIRHSIHDNIVAGFEILKEDGFTPWRSSKKCWEDPTSTDISTILDKARKITYN